MKPLITEGDRIKYNFFKPQRIAFITTMHRKAGHSWNERLFDSIAFQVQENIQNSYTFILAKRH
jgi:hypothetical protein